MSAGNVIYLLGVDMISGTPVIDIKPYIPQYDSPWSFSTVDSCVNQREPQHYAKDSATKLAEELEAVVNLPSVNVNKCNDHDDDDDNDKCSDVESLSSTIASDSSHNTAKCVVSVAKWITDPWQLPALLVVFTPRAEDQLKQFDSAALDVSFKLHHLTNAAELRSALTAVLRSDPRSVYRREHCQHQLYYVTVDVAHVTCWFDADTVEVLKVQSTHLLHKH